MTCPLITDEPAVLTWAIALARRGVLPDDPPKRHWWRELVTSTWRDAYDQWHATKERDESRGGSMQLEDYEYRERFPVPRLSAFMVGLSGGAVTPGVEPEKVA